MKKAGSVLCLSNTVTFALVKEELIQVIRVVKIQIQIKAVKVSMTPAAVYNKQYLISNIQNEKVQYKWLESVQLVDKW